MIFVVYLEAVLLLALTLGYVGLVAILAGTARSGDEQWYLAIFLACGTYGFLALWWILVAAVFSLRNHCSYSIPWVVKIGIVVGCSFGCFILFFAWGFARAGYDATKFNTMSFLVFLLFLIVTHCLLILRRAGSKAQR